MGEETGDTEWHGALPYVCLTSPHPWGVVWCDSEIFWSVPSSGTHLSGACCPPPPHRNATLQVVYTINSATLTLNPAITTLQVVHRTLDQWYNGFWLVPTRILNGN